MKTEETVFLTVIATAFFTVVLTILIIQGCAGFKGYPGQPCLGGGCRKGAICVEKDNVCISAPKGGE